MWEFVTDKGTIDTTTEGFVTAGSHTRTLSDLSLKHHNIHIALGGE